MIPFFDSTGMIYMHWVPTGQTVNKEYSSNWVSGISTRTMHQFPTPSLSQTIWPRWASRQLVTLPIVQTLLPVTFGYSLSSRKNLEAVVMGQLRRWKRLRRRSLTLSHERTSMGPSKCVAAGDFFEGDEFHVYTLNKSAHLKKVWKLIVCSLYFLLQKVAWGSFLVLLFTPLCRYHETMTPQPARPMANQCLLQQTRSCCRTSVHNQQLCLGYHQHFVVTSTYTPD